MRRALSLVLVVLTLLPAACKQGSSPPSGSDGYVTNSGGSGSGSGGGGGINPANNPAPPPNHQIRFGYYYADGRYGDYTQEVNPYTNLYIGLPRGYLTNLDWRPLFQQSLTQAAAQNRVIFLSMDEETLWDEVLTIAAPFWSRIELVEVGHETSWDKAETEAKIAALKSKLNQFNLAPRPIGIVWSIRPAMTNTPNDAVGLDWVGIEAYVDGPGSANSPDNVTLMNDSVNVAKGRVPAGKSIVLVMQSYDRNFNWTNIDTLEDLQMPTYLLAASDPRVIAIFMFSYARPGGSRDHPQLQLSHKQIGARILAFRK